MGEKYPVIGVSPSSLTICIFGMVFFMPEYLFKPEPFWLLFQLRPCFPERSCEQGQSKVISLHEPLQFAFTWPALQHQVVTSNRISPLCRTIVPRVPYAADLPHVRGPSISHETASSCLNIAKWIYLCNATSPEMSHDFLPQPPHVTLRKYTTVLMPLRKVRVLNRLVTSDFRAAFF